MDAPAAIHPLAVCAPQCSYFLVKLPRHHPFAMDATTKRRGWSGSLVVSEVHVSRDPSEKPVFNVVCQ